MLLWRDGEVCLRMRRRRRERLPMAYDSKIVTMCKMGLRRYCIDECIIRLEARLLIMLSGGTDRVSPLRFNGYSNTQHLSGTI